MNTLQTSIKKVLGQGYLFFMHNTLKSEVVQSNRSASLMRNSEANGKKDIKEGRSKPNKLTSDANALHIFEAGLNAIDANLYALFMMHMEGYKDCEIADYLSISEKEVAIAISKVRNTLQKNSCTAIH